MFCTECGKEILGSSNFCQNCGMNLSNGGFTGGNDFLLEEIPYDDDTGLPNPNWKKFVDSLSDSVDIDKDSFRKCCLLINSVNIKIQPYTDYASLYLDIKNLAVKQKRNVSIVCKLYDKNNKIIDNQEDSLWENDFSSSNITIEEVLTYNDLQSVKRIRVFAKLEDY